MHERPKTCPDRQYKIFIPKKSDQKFANKH